MRIGSLKENYPKTMKTISIRLFALFVLTFALGAAQLIAQTPGKPAPTPAKVLKNPLDKGDFKVGFSPQTRAKDPTKVMPKEEREAFQGIATELNSIIALPRDIYLNLDTCGTPNAFYSPSTSEITFCYELLAQFEQEFKTVTKDEAEIDKMVQDTMVQTLFHELGHCLIDVWDMPATGREEDAVDQLATVLLLDGSPEGQLSAIHAALEFEIASHNDIPNDMVFWDEHSFSKTRFYDMLCLVYGSNPEKSGGLVGPDLLPEQRAVRCPTEYKRADHAWMKLLEPYLMK
jgi:hypothetical protein